MTDACLVIGVVRSPEGGELAVEVGRFVCEFGRTEPVNRIRACLMADLQKLVADLIDGLIPGEPLPLAVDQLLGVAQAALAQHIVSDCRSFAAMRTAIDGAVIIRLLADPHTVCDFGDHRATYRAMGAEILPDSDGLAGGGRRACPPLGDPGNGEAARGRTASSG